MYNFFIYILLNGITENL